MMYGALSTNMLGARTLGRRVDGASLGRARLAGAAGRRVALFRRRRAAARDWRDAPGAPRASGGPSALARLDGVVGASLALPRGGDGARARLRTRGARARRRGECARARARAVGVAQLFR